MTSCDAVDWKGPTKDQCNATYSLTNMKTAQYWVENGIQHFIAPFAGKYKIVARGPAGRAAIREVGRGATVTATFDLLKGDEIQCVQKCCSDYLNLVIFGDFRNNFRRKIEIFKIVLSKLCLNALYV